MHKMVRWFIRPNTVLLMGVILVSGPVSLSGAAEPWVERIQTPQYFAVSVEDVARSADWYVNAFGLRKLDDTEAEDGRWRIVNLANDDLSVEIIRDNRDAAVERARGFAKVGFRVPDVEAVADRVEAILGERPRVVEFARHEIKILQLLDPDGNKIQLSSPLEEQTPDEAEKP